MARRYLAFDSPVHAAIAADATSPVSFVGDEIWSTVAGQTLTFDGTKWAAPAGGGAAGTAVDGGAQNAGRVPVADSAGLLRHSLFNARYPMAAMDDPFLRDEYFIAMNLGGVPFLTYLSPDDVNARQYNGKVMQPAAFSSRLRGWAANPGSATGTTENAVIVTTGVAGARSIEPTFTQNARALARVNYSTSAAVNQTAGMYNSTQGHHVRSPGPEHFGGLFMHTRVAFPNGLLSGHRLFIGWSAAPIDLSVDPSTYSNICGFVLDAADSSAFSFVAKQGSVGVKTAVNLSRVGSSPYAFDFAVGVAPGNAGVVARGSYRRHVGVGSYYQNVSGEAAPALAQWMFPCVYVGTGTNTSAAAIDITHLYTDSDL